MAKKGRPSSYRDEYAEQARKLCLLGATDKEIAKFIGIAESTLNNWKLKVPEFVESLKLGRMGADMTVSESLYNRAVGGDVTACIFWLKNRRPDLWRDKPIALEYDEVAPQRITVTVVDASKDAAT